MLKYYISKHPDYWEFEDEMKEVERLKELCNTQNSKYHIALVHKSSKIKSYV